MSRVKPEFNFKSCVERYDVIGNTTHPAGTYVRHFEHFLSQQHDFAHLLILIIYGFFYP